MVRVPFELCAPNSFLVRTGSCATAKGGPVMFDGFDVRDVATRESSIHVRIGGSGPPLLLLHGYPQTHVMWHRVAPVLAQHFTVVCPDLRGYGDSDKPSGGGDHAAYSKRTMAQDQLEVMRALGFDRFAV